MTVTPGYQAEIQVQEGGTGGFSKVGGVVQVSHSFPIEDLDATHFEDSSRGRIYGLGDSEVTIEFDNDPADAGQTDIEDARFNRTEIDVEFSPNENDSNATTVVYAFTGIVTAYNPESSVDGKSTVSVTISNSDGADPTLSGSFT